MANSARLGLTASLCQDLLPGGCIMYETTIKFQLVQFFYLQKSVVLFSHPTQPTHEFGGPGQAQNGVVKGPRYLY